MRIPRVWLAFLSGVTVLNGHRAPIVLVLSPSTSRTCWPNRGVSKKGFFLTDEGLKNFSALLRVFHVAEDGLVALHRTTDTSRLTDHPWRIAERLLLRKRPGQPPVKARVVFKGILPVNGTACPWWLLPQEFPPMQDRPDRLLVVTQPSKWQTIRDDLRGRVRVASRTKPRPRAIVMDSPRG
jgi:transposase